MVDFVSCGCHIIECVRRIACREYGFTAHLSRKCGHTRKFFARRACYRCGIRHRLLELLRDVNRRRAECHERSGYARGQFRACFRESRRHFLNRFLCRLQAFGKRGNIRRYLDHKVSYNCQFPTSLLVLAHEKSKHLSILAFYD